MPRDPELQHRPLPQSPEAEQGILSSILMAPDEILQLCEMKGVAPDWFHIPAHGMIYFTMQDMRERGAPIEAIALSQRLRDEGIMEQVGGPSFVMQLCTLLPTAANASHYIDVVMEKKILRELIRVNTEIAERCYSEQYNVPELLVQFAEHASKVETIGLRKDMECLTGQAMQYVEDRIDESILDLPSGIPTGIPVWDNSVGPIRAGRYLLLGARPGVGKTAMLESMAMHQVRAGFRVAIFQGDMPTGDMMGRIACREANVVFEDFDQGRLTNQWAEIVRQRMLAIDRDKLRIYRPNVFCAKTIRAVLREERARGGIDITYIDVVQKLKQGNRRNMFEELAEQSEQLREITSETGIPIVGLAHMNRDADSTRRPTSGQFKGCDAFFSDCDTSVLMWSDEDPKELLDPATGRQRRQEILLVIDKNRGGMVGEEKLYFDRPKMRYHAHRVN